MATKTAEEALQDYIKSMGEPLGRNYHALWQEVAWLYTKWAEYVALFGKKSSRVELLNIAAPIFFGVIQRSLWEDTILHIARLTNPPETYGQENLTITTLPQLVTDNELREILNKKIEIAKETSEFCKDHRNRHIAHKDLALALGEGAKPLEPTSREMIKNALSSIVDVLNTVVLHYQDSESLFDTDNGFGSAETLLYIINDGLKFDKEKTERIKSGNYTEDDLKPIDDI